MKKYFVRIITLALALSLTMGLSNFAFAAGEKINVALGKKASSPSNPNCTNTVTDGLTNLNNLRWTANLGGAKPENYIIIDLGREFLVDSAKIQSGKSNDGTVIPLNFELQYQSAGQWLAIPGSQVTNTVGSGIKVNDITFTQAVRASKIRFYSTDPQLYQILEIDLYTTAFMPTVTYQNNSTVTAAYGENVVLQAKAASQNGGIEKVKFYDNNMYIGDGVLDGSIYKLTVNSISYGTHYYTARAIDTLGIESALSYTHTVMVEAPAVNLAAGKTITLANFTGTASVLTDGDESNNSKLLADATNLIKEKSIVIDLGGSYKISSMQLVVGFGTTNPDFPDYYTIEYYNSGAWTTIANVNVEHAFKPTKFPIYNNLQFDTVTAEKVRFKTDTVKQFRITELRIWEHTNTAPSVQIISPTEGEKFSTSSPITLTAKAIDTDGGISSVEFYKNGEKIEGEIIIDGDNYSIILPPQTSGTYAITAKATDINGMAKISDAVNILVSDNKPPVVTITSPTNNQIFCPNQSVTVSVTATDEDGTVEKVEFFNYLMNRWETLLGQGIKNGDIYTFTIDNISIGEELYLYAKATDDSGETTVSEIVYIQAEKKGISNVALNKSVTALPAYSENATNPQSVVDGIKKESLGNYKWYVTNAQLSGSYLEIDLGEKTVVDYINVHSGYIGGSYDGREVITDYKLQYYNDGWYDLTSFAANADKENYINLANSIVASKIKLIPEQTTGSFRIREIEVFGKVQDYIVNSFAFDSSDLVAGGTITASASVTNIKDTQIVSPVIMAALYNKVTGRMERIVFNSTAINAGLTENIIVILADLPHDIGNYYVKAFAFDSLSRLSPVKENLIAGVQ